jgi:hydroxymethylpyrimidine/phosphomethylpyrimidine kinase
VIAQVRAVRDDIGIDAVKIGMLGDRETIEAVAVALDGLAEDVPVVLDPVMVSESGAELLEPAARKRLVELLLPRVTVITPNVPEAVALLADGAGSSSLDPASLDPARLDPASLDPARLDPARLDPADLARAIRTLGPPVVVVTGGHREAPVDVFFDGDRLELLDGERHPDGAAHGSGCTHSSVLAARLAWGDDPLDAARVAKELASRAVRDGLQQIGEGAGPVDVLGVRGHIAAADARN